MAEFEKNPNPTKDQHFMVDQNVIADICRKANICDGENVVEIGGGAGALTEVLAPKCASLTVIELDHYYAELLKKKFENYSNVTIVEGNALDYSYLQYDRIVANLPYTITEPFLVNLARSGALYKDSKDVKSSKVKSITLIVSQNSARKMVAPIQITEGKSKHFNNEFGCISAICQTCLDVEIAQVIPSSAFFPEPAVTSILVNLTPKKKKSTVDRIMGEILMDRNGRNTTVGKVYQTMLLQGRIYKINKHKAKSNQQQSISFTSKQIECSSVYDLTNAQISQLIKDLVRNDTKMKCLNKSAGTRRSFEDSYDYFLKTGRYDYDETEEWGEEEEQNIVTKWQKRAEETYAYFYYSKKYNTLLHRGLEYVSKEELSKRLIG